MFKRKHKHSQTPLNTLLELYNEVANTALNNIHLEQSGNPAEALQGWKALHTTVLYKLDAVDKVINNIALTEEEEHVLSEIQILQSQSDDHLTRLQTKLNEDNQARQKQRSKSNPGSLTSSSLNVPTLRTSNPQPMQTRKRAMQKTLRTTTSNNRSATSNNAKTAASLSWTQDEEHAHRNNWSPSSSLNVNKATKSYSSMFDSFSDTIMTKSDTALKELEREATLRELEKAGNSSREQRTKSPHLATEENLIDLDTELQSLELTRLKSPPSNSATEPSSTHTNSTPASRKAAYVYKQPSVPKFVITKQKQSYKNPSNTSARPQLTRPPPKSASLVSVKKTINPATASSTKPSSSSKKPSTPRSRSVPTSRKKSPSLSPNRPPTKKESLSSDTSDNSQDDSDKIDDSEALIASLRGVDPLAAKQILNEIIVHGDEVHWEDIAGLESAKNSLKETVVYPFLRPDLFSGLREPARGMLLFGPPGTGKTMLARAVATESKSTFFSISASSLTSKFLGESEKLVRALFQLAKKLAPAIIFVDEIDSLLSSRNQDGENESSRRIKNEFLVQWSDLTKAAAGKDSGEDLQRVLVLAATNLPWAIDEAARRRFVRRQYIPLPEEETRKAQLSKLLSYQNHTLSNEDFTALVKLTEGFSGSDITALAKDAAMGPLRQLGDKLLMTNKNEIRPVSLEDFKSSLNYIRPSVSKEGLLQFEEWAKLYGSSGV
ncbi:Putative ATPase [Komagataella phaffii CBS 7435]|uniref:ATPase of the AAA family n=2 Tax=Komagataella phaffii TaxID=460519 RepID=C4R795_KOMPG|nr:Putative ATPase of the AAA family [Komagataella phaffii GS115]AOA64511.1 GQ67_04564T0 [Komagataella phaffii]CAH2451157.1 Putative ATPase [Komagataella phaffii CBS 7435]AOA70297.1 GQ68_04536T0 [Komagataella phaffii GS115]CAY71470.1 Putative ATPase of the AAA family [Komagataella phaffii GS115]CCA40920.1 Putative ATPase [Komagataella phaffii CBS 7435]